MSHAVLSPSGGSRWMTCIGAPRMEKGLPDEPNDYSDEGTCAHEVGKMAWTEQRPATAYVGRRINLGHRTWEVDDDMGDEVEKYLTVLRALAVNGESYVEVKVPIGHITGEKDAEGTADFVVIDAQQKELIVVDLKYGMGVQVFAKDNPQLMLYLLGVYDQVNLSYDIERVRGIIHQPRLGHVDEETWTIAELEAFRQKVKEKAAMATEVLALDDMAEIERWLLPSDAACKFCKAKATCPALAKRVQKELGADFEVLASPKDVGKLVEALVPVSPSEAGVKMDAVELVEIWCKAVRSRVETLLLTGVPVPSPSGGYKIVEGRQGNRAWTDKEEAEKLLKSFRLKVDEMYTLKVISPTATEKLLEKEHPKQWKTAQKLITRAPASKSVAPMRDKRPAVELATQSAADFSPLDDGDDLI